MIEPLLLAPPAPKADEQATQQLLQWLQHHTQFRNLHEDSGPLPARSRQRLLLDWLPRQVVAKPEEFQRTAYVSASLKQDSAVVARVMTISNWVDGVGYFNLLLFAHGIRNPIGWISAVPTSCILLMLNIEAYFSVARGWKDSRRLAYAVDLIGLLPISALKTLGMGIVVEVIHKLGRFGTASRHKPDRSEPPAGARPDRPKSTRRFHLSHRAPTMSAAVTTTSQPSPCRSPLGQPRGAFVWRIEPAEQRLESPRPKRPKPHLHAAKADRGGSANNDWPKPNAECKRLNSSRFYGQ